MEDYNEDENKIINEKLTHNNIIQINNLSTANKATVKIIQSDGFSSGFFLKTKRNEKPFYCLITNNHVISEKEINAKDEIHLIFDGQKKLKFNLDKEERIIICLDENLKLDVTIVEILPKDNLNDSNDSNFFQPYEELDELNEKFLGNDIRIVQFPEGGEISLSTGKIIKFFETNSNCFFHDASTKKGSSGSPIMLKGDDKVFGIHRGSNQVNNIGIFIGIIIDIIMSIKKNGKRREFYDNGKIKYEGNFKDDEYEDENAKYYYENEDYYIGPFKNSKKNGKGKEYYKNNKLKYDGNFKEDKYDDEKAIYYYENGEYYIGSFKEGKRNGKGIEYYEKDKIKYDGNYLNNLYDGEGTFQYENGDVYIGQFKNGKKNGKGCIYKNNGEIEEDIEFIDDVLITKKESDDQINENNINNIDDNNESDDNESKDEDKNNDKNNYKNISNESNNNSNNNQIRSAFIQFAELLHPLFKESKCTRTSCGHKAKYHKKIEFGKWKCERCPKDDDICSMVGYD